MPGSGVRVSPQLLKGSPIQSNGVHIAVSGLASGDPDYRVVDSGPDWLTGGRWGPEGGLAAVVAMFFVLFYLYGRYLRRMEWKA